MPRSVVGQFAIDFALWNQNLPGSLKTIMTPIFYFIFLIPGIYLRYACAKNGHILCVRSEYPHLSLRPPFHHGSKFQDPPFQGIWSAKTFLTVNFKTPFPGHLEGKTPFVANSIKKYS